MTPARPQPKSPLIRKKQKAPLLGKNVFLTRKTTKIDSVFEKYVKKRFLHSFGQNSQFCGNLLGPKNWKWSKEFFGLFRISQNCLETILQKKTSFSFVFFARFRIFWSPL